jgi:hypothetical protein
VMGREYGSNKTVKLEISYPVIAEEETKSE